MQTDASTRRTGRLSREDQRRLGDILQRVYDDVVKQGVPDRFRHLLEELENRPEGEQMRSKGSAERPSRHKRAAGWSRLEAAARTVVCESK